MDFFSVLLLVKSSGGNLLGFSSHHSFKQLHQNFTVKKFLFRCFGAKMQFKLLWELDSHELRTVFRRVGKRGDFEESQGIVQ